MDQDDLVLAEFENSWKAESGSFAKFLQSHPNASPRTLLELVKIDLDLQWRNLCPKECVSNDYQSVVAKLRSDELAELVAWEYAVRNECGDCVSREILQNRHPEISQELSKHLALVSHDISWPTVKALNRGTVTHEVLLDRSVEGGRSRLSNNPPTETSTSRHRINLVEFHNVTLSRTQFSILRTGVQEIQISNNSQNRAIVVESNGVLSAGASLKAKIPATILLTEDLSIVITPGSR